MPEFSLPLRIYIEDTDAGGIVFYANYLKFFERARTEFIRARGIELRNSFDDGLSFVVNRVELDYRQPCLLDELLSVTAKIIKVGASYMVFEQRVLDAQGQVRVSGQVRVVCVSYPGLKPVRLSQDLKQVLQRELAA